MVLPCPTCWTIDVFGTTGYDTQNTSRELTELLMKKLFKVFLLLVLIAIGGKIAGFFFGEFVMKPNAINAAKNAIAQMAQQQNMPVGMFGVKWGASRSEVKASRAVVANGGSGEMYERMTIEGRPAVVAYEFGGGDFLTMFIITYNDPVTTQNVTSVQNTLVSRYGPMSDLKTENVEQITRQCSKRATSNFEIDHCVMFYTNNGQKQEKEQVMFYKLAG